MAMEVASYQPFSVFERASQHFFNFQSMASTFEMENFVVKNNEKFFEDKARELLEEIGNIVLEIGITEVKNREDYDCLISTFVEKVKERIDFKKYGLKEIHREHKDKKLIIANLIKESKKSLESYR